MLQWLCISCQRKAWFRELRGTCSSGHMLLCVADTSLTWRDLQVICVYICGHAYGWGPIGWLYPT